MPEVLEWLLRLEVWRRILGDIPLRKGGLLDQPLHFLDDLAVADVSRRLYQQVKSAEASGVVTEADQDTPQDAKAVTIDLMKELNLV